MVITTYSTSAMSVSASAMDSTSPSTLIPTIACRMEAHGERVRDGDDLHHALVEQLLDALAHGRLGEADGLADRGVRPTAVLLELLDDGEADGIQVRSAAVPGLAGVPVLCASTGHGLTVHDVSTVPQGRGDEIRCLRNGDLRIPQPRRDQGC